MSNRPLSVHRSVFALIAFGLCAYVLVYVIEIKMAGLLGVLDYGQVRVALRLMHNLVHILLFGQDGITLLFMGRYQASPEQQAGFLRWLVRSLSVRMLLLWLITLGLWCFQGDFAEYEHISSWLGYVPFVMALHVVDRFFLYQKRYWMSYLPRNVFQPLMLLLILMLFPSSDWRVVLHQYGGVCIAISLWQCMMCYRFLRPSTSYVQHRMQWWRHAWQYWGSVVVIQSSRSLNLLLLAALGSVPEEVGYFSAILAVILVLQFVSKPIDHFFKPWISREHRSDLLEVLTRCNRVRWSLVGGLWLGVMLGAELILSYFGPDFVPYAQALRFGMTCYTVYAMGYPALELLNFTGHTHLSAACMLVKLLLMLGMSVVLIPYLGIWGCLYADGLTNVLVVLMASWWSLRRLEINIWRHI